MADIPRSIGLTDAEAKLEARIAEVLNLSEAALNRGAAVEAMRLYRVAEDLRVRFDRMVDARLGREES